MKKSKTQSNVEDLNTFRENKNLYDTWRAFKLLAGFLGILAIIPTAIDYELNYSEQRSVDHCKRHENYSALCRWMTLVCSFFAIACLFPARFYYLRWRKHLILVYGEMTALRKMSIHEIAQRCRKQKYTDYLNVGTVLPILIYLVFPYPYLSVIVYVSQVMVENTDMCYYLTELLFAFMFIRLAVFVFFAFSYSKYQGEAASWQCEKYGLTPKSSLSLKYILNEQPLFILSFLFILPAILIFAELLRIFEGPAQDLNTGNDFHLYQNCLWLIFVSMTTVGYGVLYPITLLGRITTGLAIIWGGITWSMVFASVASFLYLTEKQKKAYGSIILSYSATKAIVSAMSYHSTNDRNYTVNQQINRWDTVKKAALKFKSLKNKYSVQLESPQESMKNMNNRLDELSNKINVIHNNILTLLNNSN